MTLQKIREAKTLPENEANAALIAAAPELLEAVATIRGMQGLKECLEQKYSKALVSDLLEQLDKVLAKARGEHE